MLIDLFCFSFSGQNFSCFFFSVYAQVALVLMRTLGLKRLISRAGPGGQRKGHVLHAPSVARVEHSFPTIPISPAPFCAHS